MMTYQEYKKIQEKQIDALPLFWAFNNEQFTKGMAKIGATEKKELVSIGNGGFMKKVDTQLWVNFLNDNALETLMLDPDFAYQAFCYELINHEFCYTNDPDDALSALGMEWDEVQRKPEIMAMLKKAMQVAAYE